MPLLVPQPLVAFDKMLEYINKMEGVDAILQEYGSLAASPPIDSYCEVIQVTMSFCKYG